MKITKKYVLCFVINQLMQKPDKCKYNLCYFIAEDLLFWH